MSGSTHGARSKERDGRLEIPARRLASAMNAVVGEILPLAIAVAISPLAIIAAILMLLSPRAKSTGVAFLLGWVAGILIAVTVFALLASPVASGDADEPQPIAGALKIGTGALLLLLAARQWHARTPPDVEPELPKWMAAIDGMTAPRGLGLGLVLSAVKPKNLLLCAAAGLVIGAAGMSGADQVVAILLFTALAAVTVTLPVVAYLLASTRMRSPLEIMRAWFVHNNSTIITVLLLVIGAMLVGQGVGDF